jgi:hypothetical protein
MNRPQNPAGGASQNSIAKLCITGQCAIPGDLSQH